MLHYTRLNKTALKKFCSQHDLQYFCGKRHFVVDDYICLDMEERNVCCIACNTEFYNIPKDALLYYDDESTKFTMEIGEMTVEFEPEENMTRWDTVY